MTSHSYRVWILPLVLRRWSGDVVELEAPNKFHADWILDNYLATLESAMAAACERAITISMAHEEAQPAATPNANPAHGQAPASRPDIPTFLQPGQPNPDKVFENFVVGACNEFAHAAAIAVADFPGSRSNPLYMYGGSGLGKTHLLHAIGNQIRKNKPGARIAYLTAEQFMNAMIGSLRHQKMTEFRDHYRHSTDVLMIDDIHMLSGKDRTQEEFFHTFEAFQNSGRQVVITSDKLPREIDLLEDRLKTRFEGGLCADLQPPDLETMMAILWAKAEALHLDLPDDVAQYIAGGVSGNIRELEGALNRLAAVSEFYAQTITLALAKRHLDRILIATQTVLTADQIVETVARFHNIKPSDIKGDRRFRRLARPRQIAVYLIREHTSSSLKEIGRLLGGRDHSTIKYSCEKLASLMDEDPDLRALVETIERHLLPQGR
jgi:chromosomal replication initiator protein